MIALVVAGTRRLAGGALLVLLLNLAAAPAAHATFGGENGDLAYVVYDPSTLVPGSKGALRTIFTVARGQIVSPNKDLLEEDVSPAYSPDGTMLAFLALRTWPNGVPSVDIVNPDGSGRHTVLSSSTIGPASTIEHVTWLSDGTLALEVLTLGGGNWINSIYVLNPDGTGLYEAMQSVSTLEPTIYEINGSPLGSRVVYRCRFRSENSGQPIDDICVYDLNGGVTHLPVNDPQLPSTIAAPRFTPDGERIVFQKAYRALDPVAFSIPSPYGDGPAAFGSSDYIEQQVFIMNRDGSNIRQLTISPPIVWWKFENDQLFYGVSNELGMNEALMAPDGRSLVGSGAKMASDGSQEIGLWSIDTGGDGGSTSELPQPGIFYSTGSYAPFNIDWQAKPKSLVLVIQDGHGNPLEGLTVELRRHNDQTLVADRILNISGGRYVLEDPVAPGDYDVRAILKDKCLPQDCTPAFDIRYAPEGAQPVQMDFTITVTPSEHFFQLSFIDDDPHLLGYNISSGASDKLDDMANIFFCMHKFVTWLHAALIADTGPTVKIYTFATADPVTPGVDVATLGAYYDPTGDYIVISKDNSDWENRDPDFFDGQHANDGPENEEWHEFSHHLWFKFVATDPFCAAGSVPHFGYNNPTTCDSLEEGFAAFLADYAANDLKYRAPLYPLETNTKAWEARSGSPGTNPGTNEDIAVASLLWDLTDAADDGEPSHVIGANGIPRPFTYHDKINMSLGALWAQLRANAPKTVQALHASFGPQTPTIDVDGDGSPDVSLVDELFLMHGFFPVDENLTSHGDLPFFNLGYAAGEATNAEVGQSAHNIFNALNFVIGTSSRPRPNTPLAPHSKVRVILQDATGQPLTSANLHFVYRSSTGDEQTLIQRVSGADNYLYLTLPPYFDYLLPDGAPLPACDPVNDRHAEVIISAEENGVASTESPTLDNCTYWQAVQAASGDAAVTYTLTVPTTVTPPTYALALFVEGNGSGSVVGAGTYATGQSVHVSATADEGSQFTGWAGIDAAECATGTVLMSAEKSCIANFVIQTFTLTLNSAGTGTGVLVGAGTYQVNELIEVRAVPSAGSSFAGWSGPNAAECSTGLVTMTANKTCTATFSGATYTLSLSTAGTGSGSVTGGGSYNSGQSVPVAAAANAGSTFAGWSGPNAAECTSGIVVMSANKSCVATFSLVTYTLTLGVTGSGSGSVSGAGTFNSGQSVAVAAAANAGSTFAGWSGPNGSECGSGTVLMTANKTCIATMTAAVSAQVTVPNVVGLSQAAATAIINNAGLMVGEVTTQVSAKLVAGTVLGESPIAGTKTAAGSAVALTLARNLEACDADGNGRIDRLDLLLVTLRLGSKSLGPYDPRDADGNGVINARDLLKCTQLCRGECKL